MGAATVCMVRARSSLAVRMVMQGAGGGVFGAAPHLADTGVGDVVLMGFVGDGRIDGQVVFVAAAGHTNVGHRAAGTIG